MNIYFRQEAERDLDRLETRYASNIKEILASWEEIRCKLSQQPVDHESLGWPSVDDCTFRKYQPPIHDLLTVYYKVDLQEESVTILGIVPSYPMSDEHEIDP